MTKAQATTGRMLERIALKAKIRLTNRNTILFLVLLLIPASLLGWTFWNASSQRDLPEADLSIAPFAVNAMLPQRDGSKRTIKKHPRAYFTLIASAEYDIGAQLLICRLRHFSPDISIFVLIDEKIQLPSVAFYEAMNAQLVPVSNPVLSNQVRAATYTKLNVWLHDTVDVGVYIDADALPVRNPQGLFDKLPTPNHNFGVFGDTKYFNSGVFVFRPSLDTFREILTKLKDGNYVKDRRNPTEQDVLISYFATSNRTVFLSEKYNYRPNKHRKQFDENAIVLHWTMNPKPWSKILGKTTSVSGWRGSDLKLPDWFLETYQCELERFFGTCQNARSAASEFHSKCFPPQKKEGT